MKNKLTTLALCITLGASFVGCSEKPQKMSVEDSRKMFATLEDARNQARENALFNAATYRAENPRLEGSKIVSHGDSTQSVDCLSGDGWATVSFMRVSGQGVGKEVEKYKAKCSTVSGSLGCYLEDDFTSKPFARQENVCDQKLPVPLPKIAK